MEISILAEPVDAPRAAEVFHALANEHRVRIVRQLLDKALRCTDPETCDLSEVCCDVGELAQALEIAAPTVSYHLKELRNASLIEANRRGRHIYYGVRTERLTEAIAGVWPAGPAVGSSTEGSDPCGAGSG